MVAKKIKVRKLWRIHPRTRVVPSGKLYKRAKKKRENRTLIEEEKDEDISL